MTATTTSPKATGHLAGDLRDLILELHEQDANEIALDYAFLLTGGEREKLVACIQEFQQELNERNSYLEDEDEELPLTFK